MAKRGPKNKYNFELCQEVCNLVADGMNVKAALKTKDEYPDFSTWCRWKRENAELYNLYINSINDKAESIDEEIDEIQQDLKDEKLTPSAANVLIQTLKWKAAKYYPKMFGDRVDHDITTKGESINSVDTSKLSTDTLRKIKEELIEGNLGN